MNPKINDDKFNMNVSTEYTDSFCVENQSPVIINFMAQYPGKKFQFFRRTDTHVFIRVY